MPRTGRAKFQSQQCGCRHWPFHERFRPSLPACATRSLRIRYNEHSNPGHLSCERVGPKGQHAGKQTIHNSITFVFPIRSASCTWWRLLTSTALGRGLACLVLLLLLILRRLGRSLSHALIDPDLRYTPPTFHHSFRPSSSTCQPGYWVRRLTQPNTA